MTKVIIYLCLRNEFTAVFIRVNYSFIFYFYNEHFILRNRKLKLRKAFHSEQNTRKPLLSELQYPLFLSTNFSIDYKLDNKLSSKE